MHNLHTVDYAVIIFYLIFTTVVGMILTRRASKSLDHYFLGNRSLPWWLLGIAGMSNWFDLTGTMIITSFLYMLGPRGLYIEFRGGAVLVLAFLLAYAGKWHRRSGCMTGAEWLTYRFGRLKSVEAVRVVKAVVTIVVTVVLLAYLVRGTSLFLGIIIPYPPVTMTIILIALTTLYTMCAGFYGVVVTDLIQGVIIIASCLVIACMAWAMVPDAQHLATTAQEVTGNTQWVDSVPAWHTSMPKGYEDYQWLILVAAFYLVRNIIGGMGMGDENRYFGARDDRSCGLQSFLQGITVMFRWPLMIGFAVMGIYLVKQMYPDNSVIAQSCESIRSYYTKITEEQWQETTNRVTAQPDEYPGELIADLKNSLGPEWQTKLPQIGYKGSKTADLIRSHYTAIAEGKWHDITSQIAASPEKHPPELIESLEKTLGKEWKSKLSLVGYKGTINPEQILPAVLMNQVPQGLAGLLIVAMLAAMKGSLAGMVNLTSAYFVKDIYQNVMRPKASNRELILCSWLSTAGIMAAGLVIGLTAKSINNLWGWFIMSLTAGGLAPAVLRLYWWRCNGWGVAGGLLLGSIGAIVQRFLFEDMVEWQQFILMTFLSFLGTIGGSWLTSPTPIETLRHFYKTTRPFGLWGPLWRELPAEERKAWRKEHMNDIITVPFALLWQVTLFLLPMQLVIKSYDSFWKTVPLFLIALAGMYWFWWRNLPPPAPPEEERPMPAGGMH